MLSKRQTMLLFELENKNVRSYVYFQIAKYIILCSGRNFDNLGPKMFTLCLVLQMCGACLKSNTFPCRPTDNVAI